MENLPTPHEVAVDLRSMQPRIENAIEERYTAFPDRCIHEKGGFELQCLLFEALGLTGGFGMPKAYRQPSVLFLDKDDPMVIGRKLAEIGPFYLLIFWDDKNTAAEIVAALQSLAEKEVVCREGMTFDNSEQVDKYPVLSEKFSFRGIPIVYSLAKLLNP